MSLEAVVVKEEPDGEVTDHASSVEAEMESAEQGASQQDLPREEFEYEVMLEPECVLLPVDEAYEGPSASKTAEQTGPSSADPLRDPIEISVSKYVCGNCAKIFQSENSLNRHLKGCKAPKSGNNKPIYKSNSVYFCEICQKDIPKWNNFRIHQRIHSEERPYTCEICKKKFKQPATLKVHMRTHTGEKPYPCEECGKRFSQMSTLVKHRLQHTGEKPFTCEVCQRKFTYLINMKTHRRTHTGEKPYSCDLCHKRYSTKRELKVHKMVHTGENPYVCDICNCAFRYLSTLKKHLELHAAVKYPCDQCDKEFSLSANLKRHKLRNHREPLVK